MTTRVYYQKWRPSSFEDLVGQEHVSTILRQSTKQNRISHSYLFCGPRGSGKTTSARILAKVVNCLDPRDGDVCNACTSCQSINEGRFMDIIELDAASNRGIDEIRDIREKVNFSPVQGRRKVYIIDEAHMLTDAASNAFLKTLEEPPAHVLFILCTTEAHKILPTIISRCQRFDFRRISPELINNRLEEITRTEGVEADQDALRLVSQHASGSLRDAENILEQLAVSQTEGITLPQVLELLGLGHGDRELQLASHLLTKNTTEALATINEAAWDGIDPKQLHRQTLEILRAAMLTQWERGNPSNAGQALHLNEVTISRLRELSRETNRQHILYAVKLWGDASMRHDAPSTLPLEIAAVEICNPQEQQATPPPRNPESPGTQQPETFADQPVSTIQQATPTISPPATGAGPAQTNPKTTTGPEDKKPHTTIETVEEPTSVRILWDNTVRTLATQKGKKYNFRALLRDCRAGEVRVENKVLILPFNHRGHMDRLLEELLHDTSKQTVMDAVRTSFTDVEDLEAVLWEDQRAKALESPLVKLALSIGAKIID